MLVAHEPTVHGDAFLLGRAEAIQPRVVFEDSIAQASEVELAATLLITAQDKDWAPIAHAGRLHDRASYRYYWELLARAQATGMTLPSEATTRFFAGGVKGE